MVRGMVGGSEGPGVTARGVYGGSSSDSEPAFSLSSTISGLNGISPVCRKAERIVVYLNVFLRIAVMADKNSSLLKSVHPVRVASSIASA